VAIDARKSFNIYKSQLQGVSLST